MEKQTLKNAEEVIKVAELKRRLPKKIMHQTLIQILNYLKAGGKIVTGAKEIL